jgi:hypothetical protein
VAGAALVRGVSTSAETREEAEASVLKEAPRGTRVVSCHEIDLSDLPPLRSGAPFPKLWAVMLEGGGLPEGPTEQELTSQVRDLWRKLTIDPEAS